MNMHVAAGLCLAWVIAAYSSGANADGHWAEPRISGTSKQALILGRNLDGDVTLISVFTSVEGFVEAIAAGANTTREALEAFDEDTRASIGASVANALERYLDDDELRLPMEANILTATV